MTRADTKPRRLLWKLTIANLVFLILLYVGETLIAERHWLTTLVTYAPQQLFGIPVALLLVYSLFRKRWRALAANGVAAAFFAFAMLGFNIPFGGVGRHSGPCVRVMTYNIHHASKGGKQIAEDVRRVSPDIVCFQETNVIAHLPDPVVELKKALPGWYCASHGQLAVFSKYSITECVIHRPAVEFWRVFLQVGVRVRGRQLNVLCLHLNTAAETESLAVHRGKLSSYLRSATKARSSQVSELIKFSRGIRGPLIIMGDFNTPPRGRVYRRIATSFQDAFRAGGWGLGYTYRADLPVMRIDYIFAREGLRPVRCFTPALAGSDHRPVAADIVFAQ
jgi:vancomycin resistance protein VanJ